MRLRDLRKRHDTIRRHSLDCTESASTSWSTGLRTLWLGSSTILSLTALHARDPQIKKTWSPLRTGEDVLYEHMEKVTEVEMVIKS